MANALAIAAVTATLEYLLGQVYNHPSTALGTVSVSSVAPDIIQASVGTGSNAQLHVNVFLHQVTHNASWRNNNFPALAADGATQLQNPPLALDLHYLLTAYASEDTLAEALFGYAIQLLHENSVLPRSQIRTALANVPSTNPIATALAVSGLADQFEMIKITPSTLGREELAWVWTALKADYRPTYPFQVSVVLIESQTPTSVALPVLSRSIAVQAGPPARLLQAQGPPNQFAPIPGDIVTLSGQSLAGATQLSLVNERHNIHRPPPLIPLISVTDTSVTFAFPDEPANLPAGVYSVSLLFTDGTGNVVQSTNALSLPLAPAILPAPAPVAVTSASGTTVTLSCKPQVLPGQKVSLALGSTSALVVEIDAPASVLNFNFPTLPSGSYVARLSVDGVESPVAVDWTAKPPVFTKPFVTV